MVNTIFKIAKKVIRLVQRRLGCLAVPVSHSTIPISHLDSRYTLYNMRKGQRWPAWGSNPRPSRYQHDALTN